MRKKAVIITTGDEILEGLTLNTNQQYISMKLNEIGVEVIRAVSVPDDLSAISRAVKEGMEDSDFVIISGGLGPTEDDLTREAVAKALGRKLSINGEMLEEIRNRFRRRNIELSDNTRKQAMLIEGAKFLKNDVGSAPGQMIEYEGKVLFILPGPPSELKPMFENFVVPVIRSKIKSDMNVKIYRFSGIPEAVLEEAIHDIIYNNEGIKASTTLDGFIGPTIRLTYSRNLEEEIVKIEKEIVSRVGEYLYSIGDKRLDEVVIEELLKLNTTIATAESCTGGLLSAKIVDYPGVSKIFKGGVVCYSNESKINLLDVDEEVLKKYGAVSSQTVEKMAENVSRKFSADIGIGVSGIAGPTGGTEEKPVGLVYIGIHFENATRVFEKRFSGDRNSIRWRAVYSAFDELRKILLSRKKG
ncbi:MAG: nicotinamide-nucleotide amidase [Thermotogaceae bacterium]|jgi:nicotinamide-nucleotide amidase|nr:nicotinamide-nucleotide amidase [Thermotogaceae bacterium]